MIGEQGDRELTAKTHEDKEKLYGNECKAYSKIVPVLQTECHTMLEKFSLYGIFFPACIKKPVIYTGLFTSLFPISILIRTVNGDTAFSIQT